MPLFKFLFIFCFAVNISYAQNDTEDIEVAIGIDEIRTVPFKFITKNVIVGDQSKLKIIAVTRRKELTFRGIKPGTTSVMIRNSVGEIKKKFTVTVTSTGNSSIVRELRELIGDIEGIEIGIKGGKVIIGGEIVVPNDIGRIQTVLSKDSKYGDIIQFWELSPHTQRQISKKIQEEFVRNGMKDLSIRIVNGKFWIEGVVNSAYKKDTIIPQIVNSYLPPKVVPIAEGSERLVVPESSRIAYVMFVAVNEKKDSPPPDKMVKITAQFVELSKDYKKIFAFQWAPLMSNGGSISFNKTNAGGVTTSEEGTLSGTLSNLFPKLSSAKDAGYARVLQSGMIVVKSGQNAKINKTRDFSYAVGSGEFTKATTATISFDFQATPEVGEQENVNLNSLTLSVSLPSGNREDGSPITTKNSITTHITVKSKESAAIGGIVQNSSTTAYDKNNPGGKEVKDTEDNPPFFNLLRSKSYITAKSQFVVFVTPEIIESVSSGTEEIRKKFRKRSR